MQNKNLGTVL